MTELTEKYLRNYLTKKSLVIAAEREVNESRTANNGPTLYSHILRHNMAVNMLLSLDQEAGEALDLYLEHLRSER